MCKIIFCRKKNPPPFFFISKKINVTRRVKYQTVKSTFDIKRNSFIYSIISQKLNENMEPEDSDDSEDKPSRRNGRRKIKIEYIEDKNRRHITFSKRKAGIMKKVCLCYCIHMHFLFY